MMPRASKRLKTAETSPHSSEDVHQEFTHFAKARGVEINGVRARNDADGGTGLFTTKKLKQDDRILFVPEKAMFQPDLKLLKSVSLDQASPHAQLCISVMNQCLPSSADSILSIWSKTWPTIEEYESSFPLCWPENLLKCLPPPTKQPLDRQRKDCETDWDFCSTYCTSRSWTKDQFQYYWLIVDSRSTYWKPNTTPNKSTKRPKPNSRSGKLVLLPFFGYINHAPTASGQIVTIYQRKNGYEVLADRDYGPNEEILGTYGAHSNDRLLTNYGFLLPHPSPSASAAAVPADDHVRLDHALLPLIPSHVKDQLRDTGYLGNYALVPSRGGEGGTRWEVCFKTQVAARAVLGSCTEWEYFYTNGEDLGESFEGRVGEWVGEALEGFLREAAGMVEELVEMRAGVEKEKTETEGEKRRGEQKRVAVGLMVERWKQIQDAISSYLGRG